MPGLLNQIIGEYRLLDVLGAGGMGEVYRGVHVRLGRLVAVKVLLTDQSDASMVQRFLNEARIQSRLRHPNIATVYDFFDHQGRPVIVMEYVDGLTLGEKIVSCGRLPPEEAASIGSYIADTLSYVHSQGIIHRDLKPANVKISTAGDVKLLDFGIARAAADTRLTRTGYLVGTLKSLAPEQVLGQEAGPTSDIWSLGTVLYEMVTGRSPFEAPTAPELFTKIANADYPAPTTWAPMPRELEHIIQRCLKKRPEDRYSSAATIRDELNKFRTPISRKTTTAPDPVPVKPKTQVTQITQVVTKAMSTPRGMALGFGGVILLIVLGVLIFRTPDPQTVLSSTVVLDDGTKTTQTAATTSSGENIEQSGVVKLNVQGDMSADVIENGNKVGSTPFVATKHFGEKVDVVLRRPGYDDIPVNFSVEKREYNYTYTMEPAKQPR